MRALLAVGTALAMSCLANAETIYSTEQLDPDGLNLWNVGTQIAGSDLGTSAAVVVNGVDFGVGNVASTFAGNIGTRNNVAVAAYFGGPTPLAQVMNSIEFTGGAVSPSITFEGLTPGLPYVAQFLSWDAEVENEGGPGIDKELRHTVISSSVDSNTHFQQQIVTGDGSDSLGIFPVVTTVEFVANASTASFSFDLDPDRTFDDNAIINGATLFELIPEPTSAVLALGAVMGFAFGRRR